MSLLNQQQKMMCSFMSEGHVIIDRQRECDEAVGICEKFVEGMTQSLY